MARPFQSRDKSVILGAGLYKDHQTYGDFKMSMRQLALYAGLLCAAFIFTGKNAAAAEPQKIGQWGNWSAYVLNEEGKKVCYMVSSPVKMQGAYTKRDEVFALITHGPDGAKNVFSYITGYGYKPASDATLTIDGKRFILFTQDDTAWAYDSETDEMITKAVRAGSKMTVQGSSARGTLTTDTFSLKGSSSAHDAISKACGVKVK